LLIQFICVSLTIKQNNNNEKSNQNLDSEELPTHRVDDFDNDGVRCNVRIVIGH